MSRARSSASLTSSSRRMITRSCKRITLVPASEANSTNGTDLQSSDQASSTMMRKQSGCNGCDGNSFQQFDSMYVEGINDLLYFSVYGGIDAQQRPATQMAEATSSQASVRIEGQADQHQVSRPDSEIEKSTTELAPHTASQSRVKHSREKIQSQIDSHNFTILRPNITLARLKKGIRRRNKKIHSLRMTLQMKQTHSDKTVFRLESLLSHIREQWSESVKDKDTAISLRAEAEQQRDCASRLKDEALLSEGNAEKQRVAALQELDNINTSRIQAEQARADAEKSRDEAVQKLAQAARKRDEALAVRDRAEKERAAAFDTRNQAIQASLHIKQERDRALEMKARAEQELSEATSCRGQAEKQQKEAYDAWKEVQQEFEKMTQRLGCLEKALRRSVPLWLEEWVQQDGHASGQGNEVYRIERTLHTLFLDLADKWDDMAARSREQTELAMARDLEVKEWQASHSQLSRSYKLIESQLVASTNEVESLQSTIKIDKEEAAAADRTRAALEARIRSMEVQVKKQTEAAAQQEVLEARVQKMTAEAAEQAIELDELKESRRWQTWGLNRVRYLEGELERLYKEYYPGDTIEKLRRENEALATQAEQNKSSIIAKDREIVSLNRDLRIARYERKLAEEGLESFKARVDEAKKRQPPPLLEWDHKAPEIHKKAYRAQRRRIIQWEEEECRRVARMQEAKPESY